MPGILDQAKDKIHQATNQGQQKSEFERDRERVLPAQAEQGIDAAESATGRDIGPGNYQKGGTMDKMMDKAGDMMGRK